MADIIDIGEEWAPIRNKINSNFNALDTDKADKIDTYTKTEVNAIIPDVTGKADKVDTYTKSETNALIPDITGKADKVDTYTKTEVDGLIPDITGKADKTNVLEKDNTTEFTPTTDYHPSPKKYVDDTVAAEIGLSIDDGVTSLTKTWSSDKISTDLAGKAATGDIPDISGKADSVDVYTKTAADALLDAKANQVTTYTKIETNNLLGDKADGATTYDKDEVDALIPDISIKADKTNVLEKNNTTPFIPTTDYHPATKKFVEESISVIDDVAISASSTWSSQKIDSELEDKADQVTTYTKTEVDGLIPDISGKANIVDVLEKDNTTEFTPTTDYHPSTKAYVDTAVADAAAIDDGVTAVDSTWSSDKISTELDTKADTATTPTDAELALKADKTNVLEKDNTATFTPTADYQPATKAYADGIAGAQINDATTTGTEVWSSNKVSTELADKADTATTYTKATADALLDAKATLNADVIFGSVETAGVDGESRVEMISNTSYTPAAGEYSLFFEADLLKASINGVKYVVQMDMIIDNIDPVVNLGEDTVHDGTGVDFEITAAMVVEDNLDTVQYKWDDGAYTEITLPHTVTVPADAQNHTLTVVATDTSSNTGTDSILFEYPTGLVSQNFEGAGYDNGEVWTETGTIDPDYTTDPLRGSQSLYATPAGTTSVPFTAQSDMWVAFRIKFKVDPTGTCEFLRLTAGGATSTKAIIDETLAFGFRHNTSNSKTFAGTSITTDTLYYFWFHFTKADTGQSNGAIQLYYNTTNTIPASPAAERATGSGVVDFDAAVDKITFGSNYNGEFVIDQVIVSDSAIGDMDV